MRCRPLIFTLALLSSCAVGPDYQPPEQPHAPEWQSELSMMTTLNTFNSATWWQQLNDPLLDQLLDAVSRENRDLKAAIANIEQARAMRKAAAAGLFPTLDASAEAGRNRYSRQTGFGANSGMRNTYSASLDASWEIDLFGRTRRSMEAADADIDASIATRDGIHLATLAETAASYFELRGLQQRLANSRRNIELLSQIEAIARIRFESGAASELELKQATGERLALAAELPLLESQIAARMHRIAVLAGRAPESYRQRLSEQRERTMPVDPLPLGLRSGILVRRPDIRVAERELAAATAGIGIAKADLFPNFSLTGAIGSSARLFSDLFTPATNTASIAGLLGWPIFAGGAITARIEAAEAEQQVAIANYEQAVLLALEDAENALISYGKSWQRLKQLQAACKARQEAAEIARLRYEAGEDQFLVVLEAERALINSSNSLVDGETAVLTALTQLYKSLGGGWHPPATDDTTE